MGKRAHAPATKPTEGASAASLACVLRILTRNIHSLSLYRLLEETQLAAHVFPTAKAPAASKRKQQKTSAHLQPAWVDDDDAHVRVSLEEQKRLRKLRKSEADRLVDGRELQQRLKQQCVTCRSGCSCCNAVTNVDVCACEQVPV